VRTMGTELYPMTTDRIDLATEAMRRRSRPPLAGHTCGTQRNLVGVGDRSAMVRTAQQGFSVPDLPSPLPAVGARGQVGTLGHSFLDTLPARLIGDKAYENERLDRDLAERYGIEIIAPRSAPDTNARWPPSAPVERLFAWLHHFRQLVIRFVSVVCKSCSGIYETSSRLAARVCV